MNYDYSICSKSNEFYEIIDNCCINLTDTEISLIVKKFKNLDWRGLYNYYDLTKRCNLLNLSFILWKIITSCKKLNYLKNNYIFKDIKKYDNGLQNMLWEILNPDLIELS